MLSRASRFCAAGLGLLLALPLAAAAQTTAPLDSLRAQSQRAAKAKRYAEGAALSVQLSRAEKFQSAKSGALYNAACYYALAGQPQAAVQAFDKAQQLGWNQASWARQDTDLNSLRQLPAFQVVLARMQRIEDRQRDPRNAQLVTTDITNFWRAYDLAAKDPAHREQIYQREYFDKGTVGLQDYYALKIQDTKKFVANLDAKPEFYRAIRPNTLQIASLTKQIRGGFIRLKELYPAARFPNVYFVIGRFTSAGTASGNGMLIGADQMSASPSTPRGELNLWARNNLGNLQDLPAVVAHEHIHALQKPTTDLTLLRGAINEGMADFLAELTSGQNPNRRLQTYGLGHEKQIWADFSREMTGTNWDNWIANGRQETADKPADLGYFVGYQICRAYYNEVADKKQAVYDMLNLADYPGFLKRSRYAEKLAAR
ncbi:TPR end-of-group domain-containing protein [Hymenobacter persicinus]|uniref:Uncharacterized protein n=1 Tax=Hymenobacter persicinus TaxID=2025506 RepID=A0A4Q5LBK9_9BACT|nr:DUF2268 domain-containing putative Zn-dependent protease [Hymenobacter persicinus]RYU79763.1 hypothetical protein EWM57_10155 [Hymenobacter persicinus]